MAGPAPVPAAAAGPANYVFQMNQNFVAHIQTLTFGNMSARQSRFKDEYDIKEELGKGGFGTVRRCIYKSGAQRQEFAVKCNNTPDKAAAQVEEMTICQQLSKELFGNDTDGVDGPWWLPNRNVVNLFDSVKEGDIVYNVYEIASAGDLQTEIANKEFFTVDEARWCFRQLLEGVNHMHQRGYLHHDLKPANVLRESKGGQGIYKITDFGLAKPRLTDSGQRRQAGEAYGRWHHTAGGTRMYNAPEKFDYTPYDTHPDIWSLGCILYQLIAGYPPFNESTEGELIRKIQAVDFEYPSPEWDDPVLGQARNLITEILVQDCTIVPPDHLQQGNVRVACNHSPKCNVHTRYTYRDHPNGRIGYTAILDHPFMAGHPFQLPPPQQTNAYQVWQDKRQRKLQQLQQLFPPQQPPGP